jgi:ribosome-associated protein
MLKIATQTTDIKSFTEVAVKALEDKKAKEISILDLRNLKIRPVDVFIICHGDSDRQVEAIAKSVEEELFKHLKEKPWHREGFVNKEWILLDYVDVVIHVFEKEKRMFYGIEELWGDADIRHIESKQ